MPSLDSFPTLQFGISATLSCRPIRSGSRATDSNHVPNYRVLQTAAGLSQAALPQPDIEPDSSVPLFVPRDAAVSKSHYREPVLQLRSRWLCLGWERSHRLTRSTACIASTGREACIAAPQHRQCPDPQENTSDIFLVGWGFSVPLPASLEAWERCPGAGSAPTCRSTLGAFSLEAGHCWLLCASPRLQAEVGCPCGAVVRLPWGPSEGLVLWRGRGQKHQSADGLPTQLHLHEAPTWSNSGCRCVARQRMGHCADLGEPTPKMLSPRLSETSASNRYIRLFTEHMCCNSPSSHHIKVAKQVPSLGQRDNRDLF